MLARSRRLVVGCLGMSLWGFGGCVEAPLPEPAVTQREAKPPPAAQPPPAAPTPDATERAEPVPLSPEDLRLIAADPTTLSEADRRKRGFALRRKIMLNPDSPEAQTFVEFEKAAQAGTLQPTGKASAAAPAEIRLHANPAKPK